MDADELMDLHSVAEQLLHHNVEPALSWCAANASRLRRTESRLPFELRRSQFLELVRQGKKHEALEFAGYRAVKIPVFHVCDEWDCVCVCRRTHFGGAGSDGKSDDWLGQMQRDMALLAFQDPTRCGIPEYERLFSEQRWKDLRDLFTSEASKAVGFADSSPLMPQCLAGLTALKLPYASLPVCAQAALTYHLCATTVHARSMRHTRKFLHRWPRLCVAAHTLKSVWSPTAVQLATR